MRRAVPLGLVAKLLSAFLVLLGTSGSGFAALLCGTMRCQTTVAAPKPAPATHSCCAKKEKAKTAQKAPRKCCCEVKSGTPAGKLNAPLSLQSAVTVDLLAYDPAPIAAPPFAFKEAVRIPSFTDGSPPDPGRRSDRGRAPPAA